jgi:hypothetical protein
MVPWRVQTAATSIRSQMGSQIWSASCALSSNIVVDFLSFYVFFTLAIGRARDRVVSSHWCSNVAAGRVDGLWKQQERIIKFYSTRDVFTERHVTYKLDCPCWSPIKRRKFNSIALHQKSHTAVRWPIVNFSLVLGTLPYQSITPKLRKIVNNRPLYFVMSS